MIAARYGQTMHQINMRMAVTLLRDAAAEKRAREKKEAPTVKTEEQTKIDEAHKAQKKANPSTSIWKRRFRPLPESKAVDLFADVIGDAFILLIASGLILYEYLRTRGKPDANAERIAAINEKLAELDRREQDLEESEKKQRSRVETLEQAIEEMKRQTAESGKKKRLISLSS
jgi:DNA repair exonuclease SbcCD ATPase subunit